MKGKLIVIEGLDGAGKSTQEKLLEKRLAGENISVHYIKLPNYDDDACILVKQYLAGRFGTKPGDVNAYAASSFYAVDRFVSYNCYWKEQYLGGSVILADRYTTSNAYHQLAKTEPEHWDEYLAWLEDFEYNKLGIPKPDAVVYLDMPVDVSQKLMSSRYGGDDGKKDIHERNTDYLDACRVAADYACKKLGWIKISCAENGSPLPPDVISGKIYDSIADILYSER